MILLLKLCWLLVVNEGVVIIESHLTHLLVELVCALDVLLVDLISGDHVPGKIILVAVIVHCAVSLILVWEVDRLHLVCKVRSLLVKGDVLRLLGQVHVIMDHRITESLGHRLLIVEWLRVDVQLLVRLGCLWLWISMDLLKV